MKRPTLSPIGRSRGRARRARSALLTALVATLLVGSLAACEPTQIGAAAIVGDSRLPESVVQDRVREVIATRGQSGQDANSGDLQRLVVRSYIIGQVLDAVARREGVTVTPAEVSARMSQLASTPDQLATLQQQAADGGVPKSQISDVVRMGLLEQGVLKKVTGTDQPTDQQVNDTYVPLMVNQAKAMHVQVSPRYGQWDAATLQVNPPAVASAPSTAP